MQVETPSFETVQNSWTKALISLYTVIALIIAAVKWQSENLLKKIPWNYFWLVLVIAFIASIVSYTYAGWIFKKRYSSETFDDAFDLYLDEKGKLKEKKLASRKQLESDIMKVKMSEID